MALRGITAVAERRAGGPGRRSSSGQAGSGPLRPLTLAQARRLGPLLDSGRVALIESDGRGRIAQASVAERVAAPPATIHTLLSHPEGWGDFMQGIGISDLAEHEGRPSFTMTFELPAFSVSANMDLEVRPDGCDLQSRRGRMRRSLVAFRHYPDAGGSILVGASRIRLRQAGRVLRGLIDDDASFGHALNAAAIMTLSRSFTLRAQGVR